MSEAHKCYDANGMIRTLQLGSHLPPLPPSQSVGYRWRLQLLQPRFPQVITTAIRDWNLCVSYNWIIIFFLTAFLFFFAFSTKPSAPSSCSGVGVVFSIAMFLFFFALQMASAVGRCTVSSCKNSVYFYNCEISRIFFTYFSLFLRSQNSLTLFFHLTERWYCNQIRGIDVKVSRQYLENAMWNLCQIANFAVCLPTLTI